MPCNDKLKLYKNVKTGECVEAKNTSEALRMFGLGQHSGRAYIYKVYDRIKLEGGV